MKRRHPVVAALLLLVSGIAVGGFSHAQPANSKSGEYMVCANLAQDVSLMLRAGGETHFTYLGDWYSRTVVAHVRAAEKSGNPKQYIRDLHKACLLESA